MKRSVDIPVLGHVVVEIHTQIPSFSAESQPHENDAPRDPGLFGTTIVDPLRLLDGPEFVLNHGCIPMDTDLSFSVFSKMSLFAAKS